MTLFIQHEGQQLGPLPLEQVNQLLASGGLSATDHAWYEGAQGWMPITQVPGIVLPAQSAHVSPRVGKTSKTPLIISGITATLLVIGGVVYLNVSEEENSPDNKSNQTITAADENTPPEKTDTGKPKAPQADLTYSADINPIFAKHKCFDCHDSAKGKVKGDLDLAEDYSRSTVVDKKKPELSRLTLRLTDKKDPMPPNSPMLSAQEIDTINKWMRAGAKK